MCVHDAVEWQIVFSPVARMISGSTTTLTRLFVPTKSEMQLKVQFKVTGNYSFGIAKSVLPQAVSSLIQREFVFSSSRAVCTTLCK